MLQPLQCGVLCWRQGKKNQYLLVEEMLVAPAIAPGNFNQINSQTEVPKTPSAYNIVIAKATLETGETSDLSVANLMV